LAADESASNTIPALDSDGDGHIDWFEIDVITNGQVHPDWDYGVTGFVALLNMRTMSPLTKYFESSGKVKTPEISTCQE
jgi:hypothetical protein